MIPANQIRPDMPVVSSDGVQFGVVDRLEGGDTIKLTKDAGGRHHSIPLAWVESVDAQLHVDRSSTVVHQQWRDEQLPDDADAFGGPGLAATPVDDGRGTPSVEATAAPPVQDISAEPKAASDDYDRVVRPVKKFGFDHYGTRESEELSTFNVREETERSAETSISGEGVWISAKPHAEPRTDEESAQRPARSRTNANRH